MWVDWFRDGLSSRELVRCIVAAEVLGTHLRRDVSGCHCFRKMCDLYSSMVLASSIVGTLQPVSVSSCVFNAAAVRESGLDWRQLE